MKKKYIIFILIFVIAAIIPNIPLKQDFNQTYKGVLFSMNQAESLKESTLTLSGTLTYTLLGFKEFEGTMTLDDIETSILIGKFNHAKNQTLYKRLDPSQDNASHIPLGVVNTSDIKNQTIICFYEQEGDSFYFNKEGGLVFSTTNPFTAPSEQDTLEAFIDSFK